MKPSVLSLTKVAEEYVELRDIDSLSPRLAVELLISIAGDLAVEDYTRDDARAFVKALERKGSATATIRRRINSISAILNYAYSELDIEKRNPFSRIIIRGEGKDRKKRGTFSIDQLSEGYVEALCSNSHVRVLFPILGETGCRIGEVVGLRVEDIDLEKNIIHIRPHPHRRLKTTGSERSLPLVGYAERAMREALRGSDGRYVFPQYFKPDGFVSTHASNALNKWIKSRFNGLTAHCLRHTMRDRLRAVEAPLEMIDQIGGWSSINTMGSKYGQGYDVEQLRKWLSKVVVSQCCL
jgi:integrase